MSEETREQNVQGEKKKWDVQRIVEVAAATGAEAGVAAYKNEQEITKVRNAKKRLHNTKLLLKNYRNLKIHNEQAVHDFVDEQDEGALAILDSMNSTEKDSVTIQSIKSSVIRTRTILRHIDVMLDTLHTLILKRANDEDFRRWDILYNMYLADERQTALQLARKHSIEKRTVYKDIDNLAVQLGTLLFGIDGVR